MSGAEQLSCGGWLRARRAQGELGVGVGWGGHQLHLTHTLKLEGPSVFREDPVYLILLLCPLRRIDA